jgi:hypothetical protein
VYPKLQKYNELEYRIETSEFQMEFYLKVMEMFCQPGNTMFSVFSGRKVFYTGMVSSSFYDILSTCILAEIELN